MLHTGRGPLPVTSASGVVPMKPRMASSKSCRSANGSVFANSALAFNVAGSGPLGAIWPCAAGQPTAMMTAIAAALYVFDMNFSRSGEYDIEFDQTIGDGLAEGPVKQRAHVKRCQHIIQQFGDIGRFLATLPGALQHQLHLLVPAFQRRAAQR